MPFGTLIGLAYISIFFLVVGSRLSDTIITPEKCKRDSGTTVNENQDGSDYVLTGRTMGTCPGLSRRVGRSYLYAPTAIKTPNAP